jgi:hypothetical protein
MTIDLRLAMRGEDEMSHKGELDQKLDQKLDDNNRPEAGDA